jgi:beta-galactosidase beta subunit
MACGLLTDEQLCFLPQDAHEPGCVHQDASRIKKVMIKVRL